MPPVDLSGRAMYIAYRPPGFGKLGVVGDGATDEAFVTALEECLYSCTDQAGVTGDVTFSASVTSEKVGENERYYAFVIPLQLLRRQAATLELSQKLGAAKVHLIAEGIFPG